MSRKNSILLAGLGAIGSVLYSRLVRKKFDVIGLTSKRGTEIIKKKGVQVKLISDDSSHVHKAEVYEFLPEKHRFQNCIIATKAYNNQVLADYLVDVMDLSSSILLFQNGIDVEIPFTEKNKDWKITRAISSLGSYRDEDDCVKEIAMGETKIGLVNTESTDELDKWGKLLQSIGLQTIIPSDFQKQIWFKAIVNSTINPIGAITKLTNGAIIKDMNLLQLIKNVIQECLKIISDKVELEFDDVYNYVIKVAQTTSSNKCSMLQDIEKGVKTEIEFLNKKFVELAKSKNFEAPLNQKLSDVVLDLSENNIPAELAILELRSLL